MAQPTDAARTLRALLRSAAGELHPPQPLRILAKRRVPLTRYGEFLGRLEALLRLSFRSDAAPEGVLVFDWPDASAEHSAVQALEAWRGRCGDDGSREFGPVRVECRRAEFESGAGTHLKVCFPVGDIPDELLELFDLACRICLEREVRVPLEAALAEVGAAAAAAAEVPAVTPGVELSPEDQARADTIVHGADFDSHRHPTVDINAEVISSDGTRYRLVFKRARGARRRLWIKVPKHVEGVVHSNGARAHG